MRFLSNNSFIRVYPTAMRLQHNRPITEAEGSYKANDRERSSCHSVFARGSATTSVATHLTPSSGFPCIWLRRLNEALSWK